MSGSAASLPVGLQPLHQWACSASTSGPAASPPVGLQRLHQWACSLSTMGPSASTSEPAAPPPVGPSASTSGPGLQSSKLLFLSHRVGGAPRSQPQFPEHRHFNKLS
ncbi:unnamed protein product [Arctogadus glacialis]